MASPPDFSTFLSMSPAVETPGMRTAYGLGPPQRPPGGSDQLNSLRDGNGQSIDLPLSTSGPTTSSTDQRSRLGQLSFNPSEYGLSASAFQLPPGGLQFSMPSFMQGGPAQPFSDGPAIAEGAAPMWQLPRDTGKAAALDLDPRVDAAQPQPAQQSTESGASGSCRPGEFTSQQQQDQQQRRQQQQPEQRPQRNRSGSNLKPAEYKLDPMNPVYSLYGSSVIGVEPDTRPFPGGGNPALPSVEGQPPCSPGNSFDPAGLGLPTSLGGNFPGLYSSSGFDLMGVIARVATRPNPQINIGPVDTSCSFLVVDARKYDFPIVFASASFTSLTGYENSEVIGRNCRFLQSPDGHVPQGSKRKYTDPNAVWHMKSHILAGKESQASVINYRKNGTPFINLVTLIPIVWDTDEIAYFVGFQVDLVQQPNAILDKMRDGTYVVNYSLLPGASMGVSRRSLTNLDAPDDFKGVESQTELAVSMPELLDIIGESRTEGMDDEGTRKAWCKSILDNTDDFVHVLSLKGAFLYVSAGVKRMLEYDECDLIGKSVSAICHPSDCIPVMRELKESGNAQGHPTVSLLYRAKRKHTGYMWLEAQGKLHIEQGKGRKCVILVGRERPTYKMSWQDLNRGGGLGEMEFWTKLSLDGMCLYSTPSVHGVLGFTDEEMVGTALSQLSPPGAQPDLHKAILQAAAGQPVSWRHQLKNRHGDMVDVVTNFFPSVCGPPASPVLIGGRRVGGPQVQTVVCQTNEAGSDLRRRAAQGELPQLPRAAGVASPSPLSLAAEITLFRPSPGTRRSSDSLSSVPSTYSAVPSTFKQLRSHPSRENDNIFADLDTTKTSSWQFELHQLKLINRRLREELETLEAARKKRKRRLQGADPGLGNPSGLKACANCGRTDSPEWRKGPSGQRDLCNACGLRYSKAVNSMSESFSESSGALGTQPLQASPMAPTGGESGDPTVPAFAPPATSGSTRYGAFGTL